jgi:hypothetical protein
MSKFKIGQKVVGTKKLVEEWGIDIEQLPPGIVGTVRAIDSGYPSISVTWTIPGKSKVYNNSYGEDQLTNYIADKLDLI